MSMNERVAAMATYYKSRFNDNLGYSGDGAVGLALKLIGDKTGIPAETVKVAFSDSFDYWFPYRKGWDLDRPENRNMWEKYGLAEVYITLNPFSQNELKTMLKALGVWADE
jgi:hypothetical protein